MTDKIIVVTPPDDVAIDGIRILVVCLTQEQGQVISNALLQFDNFNVNVVNYVWNTGNDVAWLLDKKTKSDAIIFNADIDSNTITGYLAAHTKSYYFGTLKDLHLANNRAIYTTEDVLTLLEILVKKHEQTR
jgi:hypothetical protein